MADAIREETINEARSLKQRDREQARQVRANKKRLLKELEDEPKIEVEVRNHDFVNQGVPIEFNFQGIKRYKIGDGERTELPISVVEHINSIKVPESIFDDPDPTTGQRRHRIFMRQRFAATPVNMAGLLRPNASASRSKGERSHEK